MSNYFDNQSAWSWQVLDGKVQVVTDHGTHTHTLDLTKASIGEVANNTGQVMGDAHRAASHDYKTTTNNKEESSMNSSFVDSIRVDQATIDRTNRVSHEFSERQAMGATLTSHNSSGRERGDEGPASLGRDPENKVADMRADMISASEGEGNPQEDRAAEHTGDSLAISAEKGGAEHGNTGEGGGQSDSAGGHGGESGGNSGGESHGGHGR